MMRGGMGGMGMGAQPKVRAVIRWNPEDQCMREKEFILGEIRRTASLNNGKPLGQRAILEFETGIANHEWLGVHWARGAMP